MIRGQHLTKSFGGQRVVDDVSFEAAEGEFVALLGPSGGGKSTVLRMVAGLESPDSGTVLIRGEDATSTAVQKRGLGFVFQHYALFKHLNVRDNIGFGLEIRKTDKAEVRRRVDELLELVQLAGFGDRFPAQLSGGQRQRVALARALAPRPQILLLDEPFGALDAKVRVELRAWLRKLSREQKITCVFVTHDQEEALELADRVVIIHRGKVEQIGRPEEVYDQPATPFVASFIGSSNVLTGTVQEGRTAFGELSVSVDLRSNVNAPRAMKEGADVRAYVRHHQVEIIGRSDKTSKSDGLALAKVNHITRIGWVARIELVLDDGRHLIAELPKDRLESLEISDGAEVFVSLKNASVFVDAPLRGDVEDYVI
jgi:sulfate transport system ATP-binding protein